MAATCTTLAWRGDKDDKSKVSWSRAARNAQEGTAGTPDRVGRHGWRGALDAGRFSARVARVERIRRGFQRSETLQPGRQGHRPGARRALSQRHDQLPVLCHRSGRPTGTRDHSRPARRICGAHRPLHLFGHRPRPGPRPGSHVDRQCVWLCLDSRSGLLPARRSQPSYPARAQRTRVQLLGIRDGLFTPARLLRELCRVPEPDHRPV